MYSGMQLALKQDVLRFLNITYRLIHGEEQAAALVAIASEYGVDYATKNARMDLELPGVPPFSVIRDLYVEGTMTYDAYKRYAATLYGISQSSLSVEPGLDLLQLNGIDDPDAVAERQAADNEAAAGGTVTEEFVTEKTTGGKEGGPSTKTVHKKVTQRGGGVSTSGSGRGGRSGKRKVAAVAAGTVASRKSKKMGESVTTRKP